MSRMIRQRLTKLERMVRPRSERKAHVVCGMTRLEAERKAKELQASAAWTQGDVLMIVSGATSILPEREADHPLYGSRCES